MNDIKISATLSLDERDSRDAYLDINLSVDGQYIHDVGVYIDPVALAMSATMSGELFIFTCDCGNPACQGIDDGVLVSHSMDTVKWKTRNPISWTPGEPLPEWAGEVEYEFPKAQYVQTVSMALEHAKILARQFNTPGSLWVGPGLALEGLLALEIPQQGGFFAHEPNERAVH